jgi:hypothetical protein
MNADVGFSRVDHRRGPSGSVLIGLRQAEADGSPSDGADGIFSDLSTTREGMNKTTTPAVVGIHQYQRGIEAMPVLSTTQAGWHGFCEPMTSQASARVADQICRLGPI